MIVLNDTLAVNSSITPNRNVSNVGASPTTKHRMLNNRESDEEKRNSITIKLDGHVSNPVWHAIEGVLSLPHFR